MDLVLTLIVIGLAGLGIADSTRLLGMAESGTLLRGQVGPGGFLLFISIPLLICGSSKLVVDFVRPKAEFPGRKAKKAGSFWQVGLMILMCVLYAVTIPLFGYPISSGFFFCLVYYITGVRPWPKAVLLGTLVSACFYLVFGVLIQVPFPRSFFGFEL